MLTQKPDKKTSSLPISRPKSSAFPRTPLTSHRAKFRHRSIASDCPTLRQHYEGNSDPCLRDDSHTDSLHTTPLGPTNPAPPTWRLALGTFDQRAPCADQLTLDFRTSCTLGDPQKARTRPRYHSAISTAIRATTSKQEPRTNKTSPWATRGTCRCTPW